MSNKKIFVLLPDGIGLRNFAYTSFYDLGKKQNFEVVFWNNTLFSLSDLGFNEIKIKNARTHPLTDIYKNIKIQAELNLSIKKTGNKVYNTYRFPFSYSTLKSILKSLTIQLLTKFYFTQSGLTIIRSKMNKQERKTLYYNQSLKTLKKEKPALVFCTNQRPVIAIAPLLAAQDLGIPTVCFIFSWDNLPKATMVVETDYYFVWSDYMKKEILFYYPNISEKQILVTGTPQFEPHFDKLNIVTRGNFCLQNNLEINKKYICYSGDDVTTCPDDPKYLEDVAIAIRELNKKEYDLGIIFRRCPVDFSTRFDDILEEYKDVIVSIAPIWKKKGEIWNTILPMPEDINLQVNTIAHTEMVINLGSSMVFDYVVHNKPCAYINYDVVHKVRPSWSVKNIYNYVHFRSIPNAKAVIWLNNPIEIASKIEKILIDSTETVDFAKSWFEVINQHPPEEASQRIWDGIKKIIQ